MTLMEISQVLGNVGEFVGAIAVVATLLYTWRFRFGMQVGRPNFRPCRPTARRELLGSALFVILRIFQRFMRSSWRAKPWKQRTNSDCFIIIWPTGAFAIPSGCSESWD